MSTITIPAEFVPDVRYGVLSSLSSDSMQLDADPRWAALDGDGPEPELTDEWRAEREKVLRALELSLHLDVVEGDLDLPSTPRIRVALEEAAALAARGRRSKMEDFQLSEDLAVVRADLSRIERAERLEALTSGMKVTA